MQLGTVLQTAGVHGGTSQVHAEAPLTITDSGSVGVVEGQRRSGMGCIFVDFVVPRTTPILGPARVLSAGTNHKRTRLGGLHRLIGCWLLGLTLKFWWRLSLVGSHRKMNAS
jgi:hypothetical protein